MEIIIQLLEVLRQNSWFSDVFWHCRIIRWTISHEGNNGSFLFVASKYSFKKWKKQFYIFWMSVFGMLKRTHRLVVLTIRSFRFWFLTDVTWQMKVFTSQCPVQIAKFLYRIYGPKYFWPMMSLDSFIRIISRRNWWIQLGITRHVQRCLKIMNCKLFNMKLKFWHSFFHVYSQIFWSSILKEGIKSAGI